MSEKPPSPRRRAPRAAASQTPSTLEQQVMEAISATEVPENLGSLLGNSSATRMTDNEIESIYAEAQRLSDVTKRKGFKVEYHGIQKTGKTMNAMTAASLVPENPKISDDLRLLLSEGVIPRGDPVFILDTELKAEKLRYKFRNTGKNIFIFPIFFEDPVRPMQVDATKCLLKMANILTMISKKFPDRGTVVIDSATDVTRWVIKHIKFRLLSLNADGSELGDMFRLQPGDYQPRDDLWDYILKISQNMTQHFIYTSREKEDWSFEKDGDGNMTGKTGIYSAKRYAELPFQMDVEVALRYKYDAHGVPVARVGRIISNQYDDEKLAGVELENPTFPRLIDMIIPYSHVIELEALKARKEQNVSQTNTNQAQATRTQ